VTYGDVDLGAGLVKAGATMGSDGFVGRYGPNGQPHWVKRLVGPGEDKIMSVANGPNNTIFAAGWYDNTSTLDTRALPRGDYRDIVIAQFDFTGAITMVTTIATPALEQPSGIAWTGTHLMAVGFYNGVTKFGPTELTATEYDIWAAKLAVDGTPVWAVSYGGPAKDSYPYLATDAAGDMYLAGTFTGSATFGSYKLNGAGGTDIFVAKLRNGDGSVVWATSLGSPGDDGASDIALNASGHLIVSGTIAGPLEPGGPFAGEKDAVLISYDTAGAHRWTKVIGTTGTDYGWAVSKGANAFYAAVNLGGDIGTSVEGQKIIGAPKPASLVLKLQP